MLCKASDLKGYTLLSLDGEIGTVEEFYFDDQHWTIRYLVANTGNWLQDRQVLISPLALVAMMKDSRHVSINLTKQQIEDSPSLDSDRPVSRQFEEKYNEHYGWPIYWGGPYMSGVDSYSLMVSNHEERGEATEDEKKWDAHLRSTQYVSGYHIQATDGELGHVEDFIIDDKTWAIRYFVIDTGSWWPGKKVLVSPHWIERVSWSESTVFVNIDRAAIKLSPEYTEESLLTRDYEAGLYRHYHRQEYWGDEASGDAYGRSR